MAEAHATHIRVELRGDAWAVIADGVDVADRPTREEAMRDADFYARESMPSEVVVVSADGRVLDHYTYGMVSPWATL